MGVGVGGSEDEKIRGGGVGRRKIRGIGGGGGRKTKKIPEGGVKKKKKNTGGG